MRASERAEKLLARIDALGELLCCYAGKPWAERRCDCKFHPPGIEYGFMARGNNSEITGCCELRQIRADFVASLDTPPDPERDIERRLRGVVERFQEWATTNYGLNVEGDNRSYWEGRSSAFEHAAKVLADEIEACLSAPEPTEDVCEKCGAFGPCSCFTQPAPVDDREQVERVAEWLFRWRVGHRTELVDKQGSDWDYFIEQARDLLALLDRTSVPDGEPMNPSSTPSVQAEGKPEGRDTAVADREQGEATERWTIRICERCGKRAEDHYLGVEPDGCLCALEDFDPADKNQGIREIQVVPAPADREGRFDRCIHDECPHGCTAYCRDRGGADRKGEQDG